VEEKPGNCPVNVRILALMEASCVTGPAKNLIGFCRWLASPEGKRTGLSLDIATFERHPDRSNAFVDAARAAKIETHVIRERYRYDLGVISQLREIIARVRPSIIQTHNSKSHLLIRLLPELRSGCSWFAFEHGLVFKDLKLRLYSVIDRFTLRSADQVISVCHAFVPRLLSYSVKLERIRILHNAAVMLPSISASERTQLCDRLGIHDYEAVVLTIGRLSREKGHADLLRAMARLRSVSRPWRLVLVGAGPELHRLERLATSLAISERVVFVGHHPEVACFYAIASVFVLPSQSEGSSNVLLEAMSAGIPIAATRAGGNPEIVLDQVTGLLTPVRDPAALAGAIRRLLTEPDLAAGLARAGLQRAQHEFSADQYRRRLAGYYAGAIGGQNRTAVYASEPGATDT
jgi:glycosyltransferase involved in cell wall biosynthesis